MKSDPKGSKPASQAGFMTASKLDRKAVYRPEDFESEAAEARVGFPGEYPFTRGIHPTQYRSRLWTMRQYAGYGTAVETNARFRYLLSQGQTGLSVAFDLPTQVGLDSDHPLARGEVGRTGVAIDSIEDMEALFDGIPLAKISASMTINATAAILTALYFAVAEKQGADLRKLSGTVQNDILKEYIARGTYIYPPRPALRLATDIFAYCLQRAPEWNFISVSGYHIREAGSTAVQEVAFTIANAIAYLEAAVARGLGVDEVAPRVSFFLAAHNDLLEEVAKFRAARRLWARIMRERFKAANPRSWLFRFHTQTAGSTLTAQQPDVNLVRVTLQALAAVLGGTQSLHTNARDEALALPTEASALLALRTQQIIAYESGVPNTVDPLGGSYAVERLTDEIEGGAETYLAKIDALGGMPRAIESGYVQREIQQAAYDYQKSIETEERVVVGVNRYAAHERDSASVPVLRIDLETERAQVERLRKLRASRDSAAVSEALTRLEVAAGSGQNLMPVILDAVRTRATVGEISDTLRRVFGEFRESVVI